MKEIQLTQGFVAIVDDEDFDWLNQWKWCVNNRGYANRRDSVTKNHKRMHQYILPPVFGMECDHIDGNRLNNQRDNLRLIPKADNRKNRGIQSNNKSGFKGVSFHKGIGKWVAQIGAERKYIGCFDTPEEASKAYNIEAKERFGEFYRK